MKIDLNRWAASWATDGIACAAIVALSLGGQITGGNAVTAILVIVAARLKPPTDGGGSLPPGGVATLIAGLAAFGRAKV